jgi:hypothetical protein
MVSFRTSPENRINLRGNPTSGFPVKRPVGLPTQNASSLSSTGGESIPRLVKAVSLSPGFQ